MILNHYKIFFNIYHIHKFYLKTPTIKYVFTFRINSYNILNLYTIKKIITFFFLYPYTI